MLPCVCQVAESKALAALQPMLLKINGEEAFVQKHQATFGTLIDRYIEAERLKEVKALKPGKARRRTLRPPCHVFG